MKHFIILSSSQIYNLFSEEIYKKIHYASKRIQNMHAIIRPRGEFKVKVDKVATVEELNLLGLL